MIFRENLIAAAARAPLVLGEEATASVCAFLQKRQTGGAFRDRAGKADLYYSLFGWQSALALGMTIDGNYLENFGAGEDLDFVHRCALARGFALLEKPPPPISLTEYRSRDGGYHPERGARHGSAYGAFLAVGAHQDLRKTLPQKKALFRSLWWLAASGESWRNEPGLPPSTNATVAALAVLQPWAGRKKFADWLLSQRHPLGGFRATPQAPLPDLLSTATTLHALRMLGYPLKKIREPMLDFVDSLWDGGGFRGHWRDEAADVEYTFYGLLALGSLTPGRGRARPL